jgi:hypothetical protein
MVERYFIGMEEVVSNNTLYWDMPRRCDSWKIMQQVMCGGYCLLQGTILIRVCRN